MSDQIDDSSLNGIETYLKSELPIADDFDFTISGKDITFDGSLQGIGHIVSTFPLSFAKDRVEFGISWDMDAPAHPTDEDIDKMISQLKKLGYEVREA